MERTNDQNRNIWTNRIDKYYFWAPIVGTVIAGVSLSIVANQFAKWSGIEDTTAFVVSICFTTMGMAIVYLEKVAMENHAKEATKRIEERGNIIARNVRNGTPTPDTREFAMDEDFVQDLPDLIEIRWGKGGNEGCFVHASPNQIVVLQKRIRNRQFNVPFNLYGFKNSSREGVKDFSRPDVKDLRQELVHVGLARWKGKGSKKQCELTSQGCLGILRYRPPLPSPTDKKI